MEPILKKLHDDMIDLFADSDRELSFVNDRKRFNQKVARTMGIVNQFKGYATAYSVNYRSSNSDETAERKRMLDEEFKFLKESMKDIGFDETTEEYGIISDIHKNLPKAHDYAFRLSMVSEVFKRKGSEILNSSVDKKIKDFTGQYQSLVSDFRKKEGSGWYDYFAEYRFIKSMNQKKQFVEAINNLKDSGFDIEVVANFDVPTAKEGMVSILTNSDNVELIHDIIYQQLNPKNVNINGDLILPKFGQETNLNFLKDTAKINSYNDYNTFRNSGKKNKSMPKELESQYYSKGDAFAIGKGKPISALFCSRLPEEFINRDLIRNKAHFFNGSPSKDAVKIKNKQENSRANKNRI